MTHPNHKKIKRGIGLSEICIIKMVSYATANRHKKQFDYISDTKPPRYVLNDKILNWYPEYEKARKNK